jgi:hypothetical protein
MTAVPLVPFSIDEPALRERLRALLEDEGTECLGSAEYPAARIAGWLNEANGEGEGPQLIDGPDSLEIMVYDMDDADGSGVLVTVRPVLGSPPSLPYDAPLALMQVASHYIDITDLAIDLFGREADADLIVEVLSSILQYANALLPAADRLWGFLLLALQELPSPESLPGE